MFNYEQAGKTWSGVGARGASVGAGGLCVGASVGAVGLCVGTGADVIPVLKV